MTEQDQSTEGQPPAAKPAEGKLPTAKSSTKPQSGSWFGKSKLDLLGEQVELGWQTNQPAVRDLLISLQAKWQASRDEARHASFTSGIAFFFGLVSLGGSMYVLWNGREHSYETINGSTDHVLAWQTLLVTSGSVLLLIAVATLLIRVADRYAQLARQHSMDADATRRMEAAVRIAMAFGSVTIPDGTQELAAKAIIQTADNYNRFALKMLDGTPSKESSQLDVSSIPDGINEVVGMVAKVVPKG